MDVTDIDIDPSKLREARERKGFSQAQVAQAVGVQKAAISKIEVGQGLPSANILARLCELYSVDISEITNRTNVPELGTVGNV
jgi:alanine-synthesizing transaminase